MKIELLDTKTNSFRTKFEEKLKPEIYKRIDNGEIKVVLLKDYVNNTLNVDYEFGYLFLKIKELLLDTDLNISIRKLKKEFVFYKKFNGVNRECDTFKITFNKNLEPKIFKILESKDSIAFEEHFLKQYLNVNYSTDRMYKKLRNLLLNTDLSISIKKNIKLSNIKSNCFIFYKKVEISNVAENNYKKIQSNEEIDPDREDFHNYIEESKKEVEALKEEICKKSVKNLLKDLNSDIGNYCKCPNCGNDIKYFSKICNYCGIKFEWECPECGVTIENFSETCKYCGANLYNN